LIGGIPRDSSPRPSGGCPCLDPLLFSHGHLIHHRIGARLAPRHGWIFIPSGSSPTGPGIPR
jgi:hypothetical protein